MDMGTPDGTLHLLTGVAGSAARMGHALTISIEDWRAHVTFTDGEPTSVTLSAELGSLRVLSGAGGVKHLTDGDREKIKGNALKTLKADAHPRVTFTSTVVTRSGETLRVAGDLTISGATRPIVTELDLDGAGGRTTASGELTVRQTDFGIAPYTTMLGQLRVADDVRVLLSVAVPSA